MRANVTAVMTWGNPDAYTAERWTPVLEIMIPGARMNDQQVRQVTAYVMANAKK